MTDADLTRIYNQANGIAHGEHVPITTARIFAAMRATMASADERADYAWRNTNTIEKARQEEMAKRDALQAELTEARHALLREGMQRDELLAALEECLAAYSASPKRPPELVEDWENILARIDKANRQARAIIAKVKP